MGTDSKRFPLVDSLRALAALSVLAFHASFASSVTDPASALRPFVMHLDVGVTIFFLISGFVLYRPFARAHLSGEPRPATGRYALRRALRIAPGYWVALTVVAAWLALSGVFSAGGAATYYGFGQIYRADTFAGGMVQAWSLGVEVVFYAFLPVYALLVRRLLRAADPVRRIRGELACLAGLFGLGLAWNVGALAALDSLDKGDYPWLFAPPAFLTHFAAGMTLAVLSVAVHERGVRPRWLPVVERSPWLAWGGAAAAFVVLSLGVSVDPGELTDVGWVARNLLGGVVALGLLLPAVFGSQRRDRVRRLLGHRLLLWLGAVSYGIYLYHLAVVTQLEGLGQGGRSAYVLLVVASTAGAALLAWLSYRFVERPAMRLASRRARSQPPLPEPATEPALAPVSAR